MRLCPKSVYHVMFLVPRYYRAIVNQCKMCISVSWSLLALMRPENVRMAEHQEAESLTVEWSSPRCPHSGYISHYVVEYCRLDRDCGRLRFVL